MKLVFRYLKPFALTVTISIVFLFVQVLSDLSLPRMMSKLVDTGIQAGGIVPGAPEAISADGLTLLITFASEQDEETLAQSYVLADPADTTRISKRFPAAADRQAHLLQTSGAPSEEAVDEAYTRAVTAMLLMMQADAILSGTAPDAEAQAGFQAEQLYGMMPMFAERKASGGLASYVEAAAGAGETAGPRVEVALTAFFYSELGVDLAKQQGGYIRDTGLTMLGVALLGGLAAIVVGWFASKIGTSVAMRLRRDVFAKVGQFSNAEYDKFSTASLITRTTNDVQQIQTLVMMGIRMMLFAPIMGIGGIIMAIRSSVSLSWIIAVAVIAILGLILIMFAIAVPKFKILQRLIDKLNLVSRENLSGMLVIRAFRNESYEEARFEQANDNLRRTNRFIQRAMGFLFPAMMLIMNLISLLIIWVGAQAIEASELEIGSMMAFMQYAMQIIMSFMFMSMMFVMIPRALASAERIQEVLQTELTIESPTAPAPMPRTDEATITFDNVSFRYHQAEDAVLENITFTALPGQTTAFIGTTGSGKSTLVNLVPRFYDVTAGRILLNGTDIRQLSLRELRDQIGYVPQKGNLFTGDIAYNIRYGKDGASEEELREALDIAQAIGFVDKQEEGLAAPVSQGGTNFSGGQRQRLSIARALVKRAPVYIFDDSFSALDVKTDALLRKALKSWTSHAAVLVVAQRVSSIKDAEQIIVLDQGRIVDKGTHHELLERCETYRDIAQSQLTKEELA